MTNKSWNNFLINRLKTEHQMKCIEIFHFRAMYQTPHLFFNYKDIKTIKTSSKLKPYLNHFYGGFTLVLVKESKDSINAIASISLCSLEDMFNKSVGINLALRRLDKYLTCKQQDNSWKCNPNNFIHFKNLPLEEEKLIKHISKYLSTSYKPFVKKGIEVANYS